MNRLGEAKGLNVVDRFGVQDHDAGIASTRAQNPTNQGSFQNIAGGDAQGMSWGTQGQFSAWNPDFNLPGYNGPRVPTEKKLLVAIILTCIFGPFGLAYTTWRGALLMIVIAGLSTQVAGGAYQGYVWPLVIAGSFVWTIFAARAHTKFRNAQIEKKKQYLANLKSTPSGEASR